MTTTAPQIELNPGEIKVNFNAPLPGKLTFEDLGLESKDLFCEGGLLRMVFDFEGIGDHKYYAVPTIEVAYEEEMGETHWQCDFNENTILDKMDHHGRSTVVLMNRKKMVESEHHHKNQLVLHAEFTQPAHIVANQSYINFFK